MDNYYYICIMKLSKWAKQQGVSYRTAWRHFKNGKIKGAYQLESGTIIVPETKKEQKEEKVVIYARVSSSEQKEDLKRQQERLISFCNARGWQVFKSYSEIASGLNDKRPKLQKILSDSSVTKIVVEHKDRLARFGINYIDLLLKLDEREIFVVNGVEDDEQDLMQDFVSIITSFTARLYGKRRSKRKTEKIVKQLQKD